MIIILSYEPLKKTLKERNMKRIDLRKHLSTSTVAKMAAGQPVSLSTIVTICRQLDCDIADIVVYVKDNE